MSKYTTGEIAKLCGVTGSVGTFRRRQTAVFRGRCKADEGHLLSAGPRTFHRLDPAAACRGGSGKRHSTAARSAGDGTEGREREERLKKLQELKAGLKSLTQFSIESIGDIAYIMANKKELKKIHTVMLLTGLPLSILQVSSIILWITKGIWWLFLTWAVIAVPYGVIFSRWYFRRVAYICPQCHTVFKPTFKEAFWASHTPATRKLTCPSCGHHGFCVEVAAGLEVAKNA